MEIEILYEDSDILAINKPSGILVHGDGRSNEETIVSWFLSKYPQSKDVGEPARDQTGKDIDRSGVVHRLDKETSGVLLLAKTQKGFDNLKDQFQNHRIKKEYHAFVFGEMKSEEGVIDRPIGRSSQDFRKWSAQRGARGELREAITEYEVKFKTKDYSFVHIFPKTGRTHQIRVHFKAINHPLVADNLYGPKKENTLGLDRVALHAYSLSFKNDSGDDILIEAPYPEDFKDALLELQRE